MGAALPMDMNIENMANTATAAAEEEGVNCMYIVKVGRFVLEVSLERVLVVVLEVKSDVVLVQKNG